MISLYRRKDGTGTKFRAIKHLGNETSDEISNWTGGSQIVRETNPTNDISIEGLNIKTSVGMVRCSAGMYVAQLPDGFHVMPGAKFESTFEPDAPLKPVRETRADDVFSDPFADVSRVGE